MIWAKKFFAFLAIFLLLAGCTQQAGLDGNNAVQPSVLVTIKVFVQGNAVVDRQLSLKSGTSALDAMKMAAEVELQEFEFGSMVKSIEGMQADQKHYWALYVDGAYAEKGIDQYALEKDTLIEWRLEEIK